MAVPPPNTEIEKLLAELRSAEADRREAAAAKIEARELRSDEIVKALEALAKSDPILFVRQAARAALFTIGSVPPRPAGKPEFKPVKRVRPWSRNQKIRDFHMDFVGGFLFNLALTFLWGGLSLANLQTRFGQSGQGMGIGVLLFPANVIAPIVLHFVRRWVALGMLSALALNLSITWFWI